MFLEEEKKNLESIFFLRVSVDVWVVKVKSENFGDKLVTCNQPINTSFGATKGTLIKTVDSILHTYTDKGNEQGKYFYLNHFKYHFVLLENRSP